MTCVPVHAASALPSAVCWDSRGLVTQSCSGLCLPHTSPALAWVTPRLQARGPLGGGSPRKALSAHDAILGHHLCPLSAGHRHETFMCLLAELLRLEPQAGLRGPQGGSTTSATPTASPRPHTGFHQHRPWCWPPASCLLPSSKGWPYPRFAFARGLLMDSGAQPLSQLRGRSCPGQTVLGQCVQFAAASFPSTFPTAGAGTRRC